jgi:hypothetical protein
MELRRRLLAAYQLTDIQLVEEPFNLPPLASKKPSELLTEMLAPLPQGQENNALIKKKIKFSSYIGKFRVQRSHI